MFKEMKHLLYLFFCFILVPKSTWKSIYIFIELVYCSFKMVVLIFDLHVQLYMYYLSFFQEQIIQHFNFNVNFPLVQYLYIVWSVCYLVKDI